MTVLPRTPCNTIFNCVSNIDGEIFPSWEEWNSNESWMPQIIAKSGRKFKILSIAYKDNENILENLVDEIIEIEEIL